MKLTKRTKNPTKYNNLRTVRKMLIILVMSENTRLHITKVEA